MVVVGMDLHSVHLDKYQPMIVVASDNLVMASGSLAVAPDNLAVAPDSLVDNLEDCPGGSLGGCLVDSPVDCPVDNLAGRPEL